MSAFPIEPLFGWFPEFYFDWLNQFYDRTRYVNSEKYSILFWVLLPHKPLFNTRKIALLPSATKLRRLCFYTCLSFCPQGGCYPSMHCRWYPCMPCSRGVCSRRVPDPGGCSGGMTAPGVPAPEGGLLWGMPAPGGCLSQGGDPPPKSRRLLLQMVRILLECIIVVRIFVFVPENRTFCFPGLIH